MCKLPRLMKYPTHKSENSLKIAFILLSLLFFLFEKMFPNIFGRCHCRIPTILFTVVVISTMIFGRIQTGKKHVYMLGVDAQLLMHPVSVLEQSNDVFVKSIYSSVRRLFLVSVSHSVHFSQCLSRNIYTETQGCDEHGYLK